jgi:hypothetical protein
LPQGYWKTIHDHAKSEDVRMNALAEMRLNMGEKERFINTSTSPRRLYEPGFLVSDSVRGIHLCSTLD